jgi:mannose-6-phosphate isomerase-like protein (cupin superfamily)
MNIAVGSIKGKYDASDLGDDRVGVPLDPKPVFISMSLDKARLAPQAMHGGKGQVRYRRVLPPEVFYTNWSYVDHVVVPPGGSIGRHARQGVEEFYYVISGEGKAAVGADSAPIKAGDAVPIFLGEAKSFDNSGSSELEMMVVGVARTKWALE